MKILLINSVCGVGSTGKICVELAEYYENHGHTAVIAYGRVQAHKKYESISKRIGNDNDVKIHGLITRILDRHGFGSYIATKEFVNWIESYKPDIIHIHNLHGYYINLQVLFNYIKKGNIPVVWTLHDCWPFTGHCAHFNRIGCERWRGQCYKCPLKKDYPKSSLLDQSTKNYRKKRELFTGIDQMVFVTPSDWLKNLVKESFLKEYEVQTIHNGINTDVFKPIESELRTEYSLWGKKVVLGVASTWTPTKGLKHLIHLSEELGADWQVVVIGLEEKALHTLPNSVIGLMRTDSAYTLAAWYTLADVFVNPTSEDNYPTTNLEAQACGTPVVAFDADGTPETILPGYGTVVKTGDFQALKKAVIEYAGIKKNLKPAEIKNQKVLSEEYWELYMRLLQK